MFAGKLCRISLLSEGTLYKDYIICSTQEDLFSPATILSHKNG
jgi:hypothetical protein